MAGCDRLPGKLLFAEKCRSLAGGLRAKQLECVLADESLMTATGRLCGGGESAVRIFNIHCHLCQYRNFART